MQLGERYIVILRQFEHIFVYKRIVKIEVNIIIRYCE